MDLTDAMRKMCWLVHKEWTSNNEHMVWRMPKMLVDMEKPDRRHYKPHRLLTIYRQFRNAVFHSKISANCGDNHLPDICKLRLKLPKFKKP